LAPCPQSHWQGSSKRGVMAEHMGDVWTASRDNLPHRGSFGQIGGVPRRNQRCSTKLEVEGLQEK
jgi:hypothetical protein